METRLTDRLQTPGISTSSAGGFQTSTGTNELVDTFSTYFDVVPAFTDALRSQVYKIRYQVYADELGWENADEFPEGLEQDGFDGHSLHCLLRHVPTNQFIGCVRLVLNNPQDEHFRFPMEEAYGGEFLSASRLKSDLNRADIGEISRIAVLSKFRHRSGEKNSPQTDVGDPSDESGAERRRFPHIALGLYLAAGAMNLASNRQAAIAMMEPKLARRLRIFGIKFDQLADPIDHHGLRAPYLVSRECFENGLAPPMMGLLHFIQQKFNTGTSNAA